MQHELHIDIETYSDVELKKCGVYKYTESTEFEIVLIAYKWNNDETTHLIDLASINHSTGPDVDDIQTINEFVSWLNDPNITKIAHNASFERTCLAAYFKQPMPPEQWRCAMVHAAMCGLPLALDQLAKVLKLDVQKDAKGKKLIEYFSKPCKPTQKNGMRTRNLPHHAPEYWEDYKSYNKQDVEVECAIGRKISFFKVPDIEWAFWFIDQHMNDRGIRIDMPFVKNAVRIDREYKAELMAEAITITGLDNPNSGNQLKAWLTEEIGEEVKSLTKETVPDLLKMTDDATIARVLTLRAELSKTSVKKYITMARAVCADGRFRGSLQFYGANRTGRDAGRLVQVQNLPKNHLADLDLARQCVYNGYGHFLVELWGNPPDILSQLIRTAFVPAKGSLFGVSDFSAIEARVIAWLAKEQWRLDLFAKEGQDIYLASVSKMFNIPLETLTKKSPERQKGKIAELALGYQGGAGAMITMGALKMGLVEDELLPIVKAWRAANPAIVEMWKQANKAAIAAVRMPGRVFTLPTNSNVKFFVEKGVLFIELPSGRRLSYLRPKLKEGKFGPSLTYEGLDQEKKIWRRMDTYGGKLVENIVQAIARDCLFYALRRLWLAGYKAVMRVHDELVFEVEPTCNIEDINRIMGEPLEWAEGLGLPAEGYTTNYYRKDD